MNIFKNKKDIWNKCSYCGKFISLKDFVDKVATRELYYQYNYTLEDISEVYENICKSCRIINEKDKEGAHQNRMLQNTFQEKSA